MFPFCEEIRQELKKGESKHLSREQTCIKLACSTFACLLNARPLARLIEGFIFTKAPSRYLPCTRRKDEFLSQQFLECTSSSLIIAKPTRIHAMFHRMKKNALPFLNLQKYQISIPRTVGNSELGPFRLYLGLRLPRFLPHICLSYTNRRYLTPQIGVGKIGCVIPR